MAVAFRAAGTLVGGPDEWNLDLPAGTAVGDILVAIFNTDQADVVVATGWTSLVSAAGQVAEQLSVLWRRSDGADPLLFEAPSTNGVGVMLGFSGCLASGNAIGVTGTPSKAGANATVTNTSITPPSDNNGVLFIAICQSSGAKTCSGYSGASPAFSEVYDNSSADPGLALDCSIAVALGVQASAAATGSRTATLSGVPVENMGVMLSLLPAASSSSPPRGFPSLPSIYRVDSDLR